MVGCCQETRRRDARSGLQRVWGGGATRDGVCGTCPLPLRRWERDGESLRTPSSTPTTSHSPSLPSGPDCSHVSPA